jgi:hypothetical protein
MAKYLAACLPISTRIQIFVSGARMDIETKAVVTGVVTATLIVVSMVALMATG